MPQVKKLSVATVYGKIDLKRLIKADEEGKPLSLMRVIGSAVSTKTGETSYGAYTALMGQFKATNLETGEVSEAATLFLPDVALTPILVGLSQPGARGVEFAIDIQAELRKDGKPGGVPYTFTWTPLLPAGENDPIKRLEAQLLALEAPKGDKPADPPADKPADKSTSKGRKL